MASLPNSPGRFSRPSATNDSSRSRLRKLAGRTWTKALPAAALAGLTVFAAQDAKAACSKDAGLLVGSAAALAGNIPSVGGPVASGFMLLDLFVCGGSGPVILTEADVLELIRGEFDKNAAGQAAGALSLIEPRMEELADLMSSSAFEGLEFDELSFEQIEEIHAELDDLRDDIPILENGFRDALAAPSNSRTSYDVPVPIILAHYKLFLNALDAKLAQSAPIEHQVVVAKAIKVSVDRITNEFESYQAEARRQRDLELRLKDVSPTTFNEKFVPIITRQGTDVFVGEKLDCPPNSNCNRFEPARERGLEELEKMHLAVDQQDRQIAIIMARAAAMSADPFVDLETVTVDPPPTSVMLGSRASSVQNKCLVFEGGGHTVAGNLEGGEVQLRTCTPLLSRQQWLLDDDGRIRSSVADLCVEATNQSNKLFALPCSESKRQVWTRDGNLLKVRVDGANRCMKKSKNKDVLRHKPCDVSKERMHWFAFSPLRSGEVPEYAGFGPVTPSAADALGVEFDEDNVDAEGFDPGLCVANRTHVRLKACDKYAASQYWAQDAGGSFRPMFERDTFLNVSASNEIGLKSAGSQLTVVTRGEVAAGVFLFFNNAGNSVFAGASEADSPLFADTLVVDDNGDPEQFTLWRHFNGGKFAE